MKCTYRDILSVTPDSKNKINFTDIPTIPSQHLRFNTQFNFTLSRSHNPIPEKKIVQKFKPYIMSEEREMEKLISG